MFYKLFKIYAIDFTQVKVIERLFHNLVPRHENDLNHGVVGCRLCLTFILKDSPNWYCPEQVYYVLIPYLQQKFEKQQRLLYTLLAMGVNVWEFLRGLYIKIYNVNR